MSETGFNPEARAAEALEYILKSPVKIASSSAYRRDQLVTVGFKKDAISAVPMPENEESGVQEKLKKEGYGRGISAEIAAAKVGYVVKQARPEDLVIGMDTLPIFFGSKPDKQVFPPIFFQKPKTLEQAREMIRTAFSLVAEGYKNFLTIAPREGMPDDVFNYDENRENYPELTERQHNRYLGSYLLLGNYRSAIVRVETGVAIRFPKEKKIESFVSTVNLLPRSLYRICQGLNEQEQEAQLNGMADNVAARMGKKSLSITGGIDWADGDVRKILDIQEYRYYEEGVEIEKGVYYGAPEKAIKNSLLRKARGLPLTSYENSIP